MVSVKRKNDLDMVNEVIKQFLYLLQVLLLSALSTTDVDVSKMVLSSQ